jgi:hypothetical protein
MPEPLPLGLVTKHAVRLDRLEIQIAVVGESNRVESEISARGAFVGLAIQMTTLDVVEGVRYGFDADS